MGFYELLESVRARPAMYFGVKSFRDFHSWLAGYQYARFEAGTPPTEEEKEFAGFDDFIQERFEWHDVGGWAGKIAYYNRHDSNALDEFFKLLDEFKENRRTER